MLKDILKVKGVKQKWLAQKLGVSEVTVSNWVKEKSTPSPKHMEKIFRYLSLGIPEGLIFLLNIVK